MTEPAGSDPVLAALDEVLGAARSNIVAWVGLMERVDGIRAMRAQGISYSDMPATPGARPIIDVVATNQERLTVAAAHFRRALAHQLIEEGWSTASVARVFGVSRQRVSALLKSGDTAVVSASPEPDGPSDLPI